MGPPSLMGGPTPPGQTRGQGLILPTQGRAGLGHRQQRLGRGVSPPHGSQPRHRGRKLQIGITSISRKEPLRGAKSSARTSLNHNLPCRGGVQKLLAARSAQTPPSTPGYCSTGHEVPAVLVSHSLLGAQNKPTCVHPQSSKLPLVPRRVQGEHGRAGKERGC